MWPLSLRACGLSVLLTALVLWAGCAQKLASLPRPSLEGCGGLFTTVALPYIPRDEQRAIEEAVQPLSSIALNRQLRRSYYGILHDEEDGHSGEPREIFVTRMLAEEHAPPGLLAGVQLRTLAYAVPPDPEQRRAVRRAVLRARAPLARRLDRVATRMVEAAGGSGIEWQLDARLRLSAGAEVGFRSRRILVGPWLVLLAGSEDGLAFVIGHELAHVIHHHTQLKAAQDVLGYGLTLGYGGDVVREALAGILSQGSMPAFNRDKECEADYYALQYMRRAGYRPELAVDLWKAVLALAPATRRQKIPFMSSRPPEAERILRLARWTGVDVASLPSSPPNTMTYAVRDLTIEDAIESFGVDVE